MLSFGVLFLRGVPSLLVALRFEGVVGLASFVSSYSSCDGLGEGDAVSVMVCLSMSVTSGWSWGYEGEVEEERFSFMSCRHSHHGRAGGQTEKKEGGISLFTIRLRLQAVHQGRWVSSHNGLLHSARLLDLLQGERQEEPCTSAPTLKHDK